MHPVAPALLFVTFAAGVVALAAPVLLAAAWRRRAQVPWRVFFYGMLTFFVFQPVLRMSWQIPLFHWLGNDPRWHLAMLVFAALTAASRSAGAGSLSGICCRSDMTRQRP